MNIVVPGLLFILSRICRKNRADNKGNMKKAMYMYYSMIITYFSRADSMLFSFTRGQITYCPGHKQHAANYAFITLENSALFQ